MVLTDREIQSALQSGQIIVNPPPNELAYSSTSLDLTLSEFLQEWQMMPLAKGVEQTVSPADPDYQYSEFARDILRPGRYVRAGTCWSRVHSY